MGRGGRATGRGGPAAAGPSNQTPRKSKNATPRKPAGYYSKAERAKRKALFAAKVQANAQKREDRRRQIEARNKRHEEEMVKRRFFTLRWTAEIIGNVVEGHKHAGSPVHFRINYTNNKEWRATKGIMHSPSDVVYRSGYNEVAAAERAAAKYQAACALRIMEMDKVISTVEAIIIANHSVAHEHAIRQARARALLAGNPSQFLLDDSTEADGLFGRLQNAYDGTTYFKHREAIAQGAAYLRMKKNDVPEGFEDKHIDTFLMNYESLVWSTTGNQVKRHTLTTPILSEDIIVDIELNKWNQKDILTNKCIISWKNLAVLEALSPYAVHALTPDLDAAVDEAEDEDMDKIQYFGSGRLRHAEGYDQWVQVFFPDKVPNMPHNVNSSPAIIPTPNNGAAMDRLKYYASELDGLSNVDLVLMVWYEMIACANIGDEKGVDALGKNLLNMCARVRPEELPEEEKRSSPGARHGGAQDEEEEEEEEDGGDDDDDDGV